MKNKLTVIARILLGFVFFAGGIAGLFHLAPMPADLPARMVTFNEGLMASGYFMPFLKATETICGALLLSGFFVPLALVVLAPIVIHITLVNAFLMPSGLPIAAILVALMIYLSFFTPKYSGTIKQLFRR
ncbi:MAG: DoxX family membrane protein [Bdellovibrionota bacterium]